MQKLGITADNVEKAAKEYNIEKIKEKGSVYTYFKKEDVLFLIDKQNELWKQVRNDYLTTEETLQILNIAHTTLGQKVLKTTFVQYSFPTFMYNS